MISVLNIIQIPRVGNFVVQGTFPVYIWQVTEISDDQIKIMCMYDLSYNRPAGKKIMPYLFPIETFKIWNKPLPENFYD